MDKLFILVVCFVDVSMIYAAPGLLIPESLKRDLSVNEDASASPQQPIKNAMFGDMVFTEEQLDIIEKGKKKGDDAIGYSIDKRINLRWDGAVIPYTIDCSIAHMPSAVEAVTKAMEEWEAKTCIRFVKHDPKKHKFNLMFFRSTHCWAYIGQVSDSRISVGDGCDYQHVMTHEIGHVVGMYHEQNRKDRDDWVTVHWENIGQFKSAFRIEDMGESLGVDYDYESIMHYPWSAFSSNGKDTMSPKKNTKQVPYIELSAKDIQQTSLMYDCPKIVRERQAKGQNHFDMPLRQRERRGLSELPEQMVQHDPKRESCVNEQGDANCKYWATVGDGCNGKSMQEKWCVKTCTGCKTDCSENKEGDKNCEAWSKQGDGCNMKEMREIWCVKTCTGCQTPKTDAPQPTQPPKTQPESCENKEGDANCKYWATVGDGCNRKEMQEIWCIKTCTGCQTPKTDAPQPTQPPQPKPKPGEKVFMGIGILCQNFHSDCDVWAKQGECDASPGYMLRNCMLSCPKAHCDKKPQQPQDSCADPLGLGFDGSGSFKIPDSSFSSPDHLKLDGSWSASPMNARLYYRDNHDQFRVGAWCASSEQMDTPDQLYVQVDLGSHKTVKYIATQGRDRYFEHVKSYSVSYSDDGSNFTPYENGKVLDGSCDHFTPVLNKFERPFYARYVRVYPKTWDFPCMRMELYGC